MNIESSLIGQSPAIKKLRKEIINVAKSKGHILLCGPTGVGKTVVGSLVHQLAKTHGILVRLSSVSTPDHEIGRVLDKPSSKLSTILIQEIEEFSYLHQTGIKKFIKRQGKTPSIRVIITSKKGLADMKKGDEILPELFGDIKTFECLEVPPLGSRREDIPLLVEHFLRRSCESLGVTLKKIDIEALDFIMRREWRDNVRELKNVVEDAVLASEGDTIILPEYLVDELGQLEGMVANIRQKRSFSFDKSLSNLEKTLILKALEGTEYHVKKTAEMLNISDANMQYRLRKFKILRPNKS